MKIFFTRTEIDELKNKIRDGINIMVTYPAEKNSKEEGVLVAFRAFLAALNNFDEQK